MNSTIEPSQLRVFGTEMEYSLGEEVSSLFRYIQGAVPPGLRRVRLFLSNGAELYDDHNKVEYATPECDSIRDLVHAEAAGEIIAFMVTMALREQGHIPREQEVYTKSVVDDYGTTWGYHENFLADRRLLFGVRHAYDPFLISHFLSRSVETGAGRIIPTESGYDFWVAQKMASLQKLKGIDTTREKPLLNTRDEPHTGHDRRWARLHVVCGEPNQTGRILFQRIGETSLIMRLVETGLGNPDGLVPLDPVGAAIKIAQDTALTETIDFPGNRKLTALDMREQLLEQIREMKERVELPKEEEKAFDLMEESVNDLKFNREKATGYTEWLKLKATLEHQMERIPEDDFEARSDRAALVRNGWFNNNPAKNIAKRIMNPGAEKGTVQDPFIDPALVMHTVYNPIGTERAHVRANFVREHADEWRDYEAADVELEEGDDTYEAARFIGLGWDHGRVGKEVEWWSDPYTGAAFDT